jgi:hypothetical protein
MYVVMIYTYMHMIVLDQHVHWYDSHVEVSTMLSAQCAVQLCASLTTEQMRMPDHYS